MAPARLSQVLRVVDFMRLFFHGLALAGTRPGLALHEFADALLEPAALLGHEELVLLRIGVVHRRLPGHLEREAIALLRRPQRRSILAGDFPSERHGFLLQPRERHGEIDEADARRLLAVERPPAHAVEQRIARA